MAKKARVERREHGSPDVDVAAWVGLEETV